jgi:hypothetical protein
MKGWLARAAANTSCDGCVEYVRQIGLIRALKEADLHLAPRPQALSSRDPDRPDR